MVGEGRTLDAGQVEAVVGTDPAHLERCSAESGQHVAQAAVAIGPGLEVARCDEHAHGALGHLLAELRPPSRRRPGRRSAGGRGRRPPAGHAAGSSPRVRVTWAAWVAARACAASHSGGRGTVAWGGTWHRFDARCSDPSEAGSQADASADASVSLSLGEHHARQASELLGQLQVGRRVGRDFSNAREPFQEAAQGHQLAALASMDKRGPAPKLMQHVERISALPKTQQRTVMNVIEAMAPARESPNALPNASTTQPSRTSPRWLGR